MSQDTNEIQVETRALQPAGTQLLVNGKYAGLISQNPDNPLVMNPGKWHASIKTTDEGLVGFGPFSTEQEAIDAGVAGLKRNLTYAQWCIEIG